ncbi:MAG: ADOP family duplicated permease [Vicinamibacterales bacterium]
MWATRAYRCLLRAYPRALRDAHGDEMIAAFEARWRDTPGRLARARLLGHLAADFVTSLPREWGGRRRNTAPDRTGARRSLMSAWFSDLRLSLRLLARAPGFTVAAVVTLGFGIGTVTAIASLAGATLLRPLPVPDVDRVLQSAWSWSQPDFRDLERDQEVFTTIGAWSGVRLGLETGNGASAVDGLVVSGGYFALTDLRAVAGRLLGPADDRPDAPAVIVLSDRLWRGRFGADPGLVGRALRVNGRPATVVGIAPAVFRGLSLQENPEAFIPLSALPVLGTGFAARPDVATRRDMSWLEFAVRLRPGVTPDRAAEAVERSYRVAHPRDPASPPAAPETVLESLSAHAIGMDSAADLRRFLAVLGGATLVTLLLSCASVAGLMLVRAERRRREFAIRAALGSGGRGLVRLVAIESVLTGLGGAVAGAVVARVMLLLLGRFALPGGIAIDALGLDMDARLLALAGGFGLLTSLAFGLAPAWQAARVPAAAALAEGARGSSRRPVRAGLVAVQVATCVVLIGGSLAFGRAIGRALDTDLGVDTARTGWVSVSPSLVRRNRDETLAFQRAVLEAVRARPEIGAAAWSGLRPFTGNVTMGIGIPGRPLPPDDADQSADANLVTPGWFETMGVAITRGRDFAASDAAGAPRVAIVSESFAAHYFAGGDALGQMISSDAKLRDPDDRMTIVGVVRDVRRGMTREAKPTVYLAFGQQPQLMDLLGTYLVVRARAGRAEDATADAARVVATVDPTMPVTSTRTLEEEFRRTLMAQQLGRTLFQLFGAAAVVLAGLGLYALVAFAVAFRTREIGIRLALGAGAGRVVGLVVRQSLAPAAAGLVAGGVAFALATPALERFLLSAPPFDVRMLAALTALVAGVTALAALVPARRALRVQATTALRAD